MLPEISEMGSARLSKDRFGRPPETTVTSWDAPVNRPATPANEVRQDEKRRDIAIDSFFIAVSDQRSAVSKRECIMERGHRRGKGIYGDSGSTSCRCNHAT